jgi:hypothetical protein
MSMSKFTKALFLSAAATGVAALVLDQLDLDAAGSGPNDGIPGPNPDDIAGEDVAMLLKELGAQL